MTTSLQRGKGAPYPQAPSFMPRGLWLCAECRKVVHSRVHDCDRYFATRTMPTEPSTVPVPDPQPSLRKAAVEVLLAATLANKHWTSEASERLKKALEQLAEELGK